MHYPPEPFRIKVTEPIRLISREEREEKLIEAGYNLFLMRAMAPPEVTLRDIYVSVGPFVIVMIVFGAGRLPRR